MEKLKTERLLLIEYEYKMIQATIVGIQELEYTSGYQVSANWPGIDFFFYLPFVLENIQRKPWMTRWTRLIVLQSENKIIGEIGGQGDPDQTGEIELGYSIVPEYQRRGYMQEALQAMLIWLTKQAEIKRIFARCYEQNQASIHVLQKTGFIHLSEQDKIEVGRKVMMWEFSGKIERDPC
ncbi:GNAT family N-acetyltransferase [Listeria sp. PSOL-1]|uniref:GNAT family N-acetyltransferase n=1 Tax=Listeria sp. PSOL-1 TaxID=1844999 RepID=UPI0013D83AAA|nr:GNAT family protein [Listeria sp. PSOL-1]